MKFKSINTSTEISNVKVINSLKKGDGKILLGILPYVEEKVSRHITLNISPNELSTDEDLLGDYNIWLDLDIYQAELFGKKILELVENRKEFLNFEMKKVI